MLTNQIAFFSLKLRLFNSMKNSGEMSCQHKINKPTGNNCSMRLILNKMRFNYNLFKSEKLGKTINNLNNVKVKMY